MVECSMMNFSPVLIFLHLFTKLLLSGFLLTHQNMLQLLRKMYFDE